MSLNHEGIRKGNVVRNEGGSKPNSLSRYPIPIECVFFISGIHSAAAAASQDDDRDHPRDEMSELGKKRKMKLVQLPSRERELSGGGAAPRICSVPFGGFFRHKDQEENFSLISN